MPQKKQRLWKSESLEAHQADFLGLPLEAIRTQLEGVSHRIVVYAPKPSYSECEFYCIRQHWCGESQEWELVVTPSPVVKLSPPD